MPLQAALFEKITQTRYLSQDDYIAYRSIMRLFYLEYQKMNYQMDKETILQLLREDPVFAHYTMEQLIPDLNQLVEWKNLTPIQDPHKVYTVADFKNRQFQYMMSPVGLEVERMTILLETLSARTAGLSSNAFRRIQAALHTAEHLDSLSLREINGWWQDLQDDFQRLRQNHQDYLREFYGPNAEKRMKSADFIAYKQQLIRYLEEFIQDLQNSVTQIGAQLERFSPEQVAQILDRVYQSELEIPRPQQEQDGSWQEELKLRDQGVWQSLQNWFVGKHSTARQVMEVTNEIIRRVVQNAALLVQMRNLGVSNKAELRHLMTLFSRCETLEDAHRLSALVFGAQQARHFSVNADRTTDRIDLSTYEEPPLEFALQPRTRTFKPRMDRTGFADKSREKAAQRAEILARERRLKEEVMRCIQDGTLDFEALDHPVSPEVRTVFLAWIALANLSPDRRGFTEYGQGFTLEHRPGRTCLLQCTDGVLSMPSCKLIFGEDHHA